MFNKTKLEVMSSVLYYHMTSIQYKTSSIVISQKIMTFAILYTNCIQDICKSV